MKFLPSICNCSSESFLTKAVLIPLALLIGGCSHFSPEMGPDKIITLNLVDRNGVTETISARERLKIYDAVDFTQPQPYEKVTRLYGRDKAGMNRTCLTSYHDNGQLHQSLEALNGRACGRYEQWHPNGTLHVGAQVVAGEPNLDEAALSTLAFDGIAEVWDDEGNLTAHLPYDKGKLEGISTYFHPNGKVHQSIPFLKGMREGVSETFDAKGQLRERAEFVKGERHGMTRRYWQPNRYAYVESFCKDLLEAGDYFDPDGNVLCRVQNGKGTRALFQDSGEMALMEYVDGKQVGQVREYDPHHFLVREYAIVDGEKHGEEIEYYPRSSFASTEEPPRPKLSVYWYQGQIQGMVKTWYPNGQLESQREHNQNRKMGVNTAWYEDASLMLVEQYQDDRLLKGEYFSKGSVQPISRINRGEGIATLYDGKGTLMRKIHYLEGQPVG